jgi:hypothetical protein
MPNRPHHDQANLELPMKCRIYLRVLLLLALPAGLCVTGCWRINQNSPQNAGRGTTKVNPLGPFPGAKVVIDEIQLREVGRCYVIAVAAGQPPANVDDLGIKQEAPKLYQAIADGHIIVYWKASATNAPAGTSNTVLAYDADVPTKGGAVAMLDGTARKMTAEEFKNAAKAGK